MEERTISPWVVPALIGLATITAGVFTWRAGQLGSTAAFSDRQAVSQTILQEEQGVEVGLGAVTDAVAYVRYAADFAEASATDDLADELQEQGSESLARSFASDADDLRLSSSALASTAGVFGRQTVLAEVIADSSDPLPFDFNQHIEILQAEVSSGVGSPGLLDPDFFAEQADDTRSQVRGLRLATLLLLIAVAVYTIGQFAPRRSAFRAAAGIGLLLWAGTTVATLATVY